VCHHTFANIGLYVLLTAIVFATLIAALAVDLYAVAVTINSIRHEMTVGHWDLLRLTPLSAKTCITAKHGIAQIRVWRVLALEVALRMSGIVVFIALGTFAYDCWGTCYVGVWPLFAELGRSFQYHPVASAVNLILSAVLVAAYITEPLWRMRVITAFGLALSASVRNLTFGALSALALVVALHLAQVAIFAVVIRFGNALLPYRVAALIEIGTATAILVFLYRTVHSAALNYAYRKAFRAE
jgi:hypothetical protein